MRDVASDTDARRVSRRVFVLTSALGVVWALALASAASAQKRIEMVSFPIGTANHSVAAALGGVVAQKTDLKIVVTPYGGPQSFVPLLDRGEADMGFVNEVEALDAYKGTKPLYREAYRNLRLFSVAYANPIGILTLKDSPIRTFADLRGKRVTGKFSAHKGCAKLADAQLANVGLEWGDVRVVPVANPVEAARAVSEGRADAALCIATGMSGIKEVNATTPIRFVGMDPSSEGRARLHAAFPAGEIVEVSKGSTDGMLADTFIWSYDIYLIGSRHVPDDTVSRLLASIWDNMKDLRAANREFDTWQLERMAAPRAKLPYHPGAIRFYTSKGLWSEQMQKHNDTLLGQ